jgi:hypothetical protein
MAERVRARRLTADSPRVGATMTGAGKNPPAPGTPARLWPHSPQLGRRGQYPRTLPAISAKPCSPGQKRVHPDVTRGPLVRRGTRAP